MGRGPLGPAWHWGTTGESKAKRPPWAGRTTPPATWSLLEALMHRGEGLGPRGRGWAGPAARPSAPSPGPHMASNSSMRCFVLPCRICRSVLYLSRPCRMFSLWMMSLCVLLFSSLAWDSSLLRVWEVRRDGQPRGFPSGDPCAPQLCPPTPHVLTSSCRCTRSFFSASVRRFSSLRSSRMPSLDSSAL